MGEWSPADFGMNSRTFEDCGSRLFPEWKLSEIELIDDAKKD
jgi:hypothetical protein